MAEIVSRNKALAVNPLKISQPVGAALAFLGLSRSMPLEHGARGCTSFNKLFFMRHFREPIALQTTAMEHGVTVLGADANVIEALCTIAEKNAPEVIGLITTGLSEMQGADVQGTLRLFRRKHPEHEDICIVPVNASDALGCLETGYARAVAAIVAEMLEDGPSGPPVPGQVNVLCSSMLTPGDFEALRDWISLFGLKPIMIPDLGDSLDGHLIDEGYSALTYGGTPVCLLREMRRSVATLVIGSSMEHAANLLQRRTGIPSHHFASLMGVENGDALTMALSEISGQPVPAALQRQRAQLQDAMVDGQFQIAGAKVAIAGEGDLLGMLGGFIQKLGAEVTAAVTPSRVPNLERLPISRVVVGDMADLEATAYEQGADLMMANSHGTDICARLGIPLIHAGYPQYDLYGAGARAWIGYRGSRQLVFDLANALARHHEEIRPYRSRYWLGTARERERPGAF